MARSMAAPRFRPTRAQRKIVPKPWGGRSLERVLGMSLPPGLAVGETWELFDRPDGSSPLIEAGCTLRAWMEQDAEALLGPRVRPARGGLFPLLIKFIDAHDRLSVQVHPDDELARDDGDGGKDEAWLVLDAGTKAQIVRGLRSGVTREQFAAVAHTQKVEELLVSFRPVKGEAVAVPPGVVHAVGPEVVLFEVQQNSDLTYRLYDWGRPREVHLEKGLRATRFGLAEQTTVRPEPAAEGGEWLFRNAHFEVRRIAAERPMTLATQGSFKVATVIDGQAAIGWRSGGQDSPIPLRRGDSLLVPACVEAVFVSPIGKPTLLWVGAARSR
jgi:mannose-6-phosphate isomerase